MVPVAFRAVCTDTARLCSVCLDRSRRRRPPPGVPCPYVAHHCGRRAACDPVNRYSFVESWTNPANLSKEERGAAHPGALPSSLSPFGRASPCLSAGFRRGGVLAPAHDVGDRRMVYHPDSPDQSPPVGVFRLFPVQGIAPKRAGVPGACRNGGGACGRSFESGRRGSAAGWILYLIGYARLLVDLYRHFLNRRRQEVEWVLKWILGGLYEQDGRWWRRGRLPP